MKKILLFILLSVACTINAQNFIVYAVTGNVVTIEKRLKSTVSVRQHLDADVILSIPEEGSIRLFDIETRKLYTLKNKCMGPISKLIETQPNSSKVVTPQYFRYIMKNLRGNMVTNTCETDNATTIFRDSNDSLFVDTPAEVDTVPQKEK